MNLHKIREILAKRIDIQKQATGIAVGVIEPTGRQIIAHGAAEGDTIFEIGSVSKLFTSLLLADMTTRNEVTLDDRLSKYLPETVTMPERGKFITLLHLSTHSSGLPPLPGNLLPKMATQTDYTIDDLYEFLSTHQLSRDPGTEYEYSNLGAGVLGHILASRAGTNYEALVRNRITQPLGMPDTGITLPFSSQHRVATGHTATLTPIASSNLPAPLAGAGALRSSANDMLTFLEAFLGYTESPLAPAMKAMLTVRRPAGQNQIGIGWLIYSTYGREIAWHNGATGGFRSFVGCDPKERTGVIVLSDASTPTGVDDIGFHLLNPDLPLANPEPPQQHNEIPMDPNLLDNYTGRYQVSPNLVFVITREHERLFAQGFAKLPHGDLTGLPKFELFAEGEKHFFAKVSDTQVTFETASGGRATSLILRRSGRDLPAAPRLFTLPPD